jgi:hypothetical protein
MLEAAEDFSFPLKDYFSVPGFHAIEEPANSDDDDDDDEDGSLVGSDGKLFTCIGSIMRESVALDNIHTGVLARVTAAANASSLEAQYMHKVLDVLDLTAHEVLYQPLSCEGLEGLSQQSEKASHKLAKAFTGLEWIDKVVDLGVKSNTEIMADARYLYEKTEGDGKYGAPTNKFRRCTNVARISLVFSSFEVSLFMPCSQSFPC